MDSIRQQLQTETENLSSIKGVPKLPKIEDTVQLEILSGPLQINDESKATEDLNCTTLSTNATTGAHQVPTKKSPYSATLDSFKILSGQEGDSDAVYEMTLGIETMNWRYKSGDSFGIVCQNKPVLVDSLLQLLGLQRSSVFSFAASSSKVHLIHLDQCSAFDFFLSYVDLFAMPKKLFFRALAEETSDDEQRKKLLYISSSSGKSIYNLLRDHYCSIVDILQIFPSCKPSVSLLIEYLPPLLPRFYSVSKAFSSKTVSFVFKVFRFKSDSGHAEAEQEYERGLCTGTLEDYILSANSDTSVEINIFPRIPPAVPFNLRPLDDHVILIANGTGFAPFYGFLQDLNLSQKKAILIYGHRNHKDGIYMKEIQEFVKEGTISKFVECLSGVESTDGHYKYVQDSIFSELSPSDLEKSIFICGSSAMGKGVLDVLIDFRVQKFAATTQEAILYWTKRGQEGSFLRELWG